MEGSPRSVPAVEVTAPYRADFAGGTLDIWPLGMLEDHALTVNAALPVRIRVRVDDGAPAGQVIHSLGNDQGRVLRPEDAADNLTAAVAFHLRPGGGIRVRVLEQAPIGSGLGGSSAYAVAVAKALLTVQELSMEAKRLVALLRDLEARVLRTATGIQDYWAALLGGVLALHVEPGGERVERLSVPEDWLGARCSVFFTGLTHSSGMVNWQVFRRRLEGDERTAAALTRISQAAGRCREALLARDAAGVAEAINAEWKARRRLAPEVCPADLDRMIDAAIEAGASAVKACGAGGGGSLLIWHEPEHRETVIAALGAAAPAGKVLARGVSSKGCSVARLPAQ